MCKVCSILMFINCIAWTSMLILTKYNKPLLMFLFKGRWVCWSNKRIISRDQSQRDALMDDFGFAPTDLDLILMQCALAVEPFCSAEHYTGHRSVLQRALDAELWPKHQSPAFGWLTAESRIQSWLVFKICLTRDDSIFLSNTLMQ